MFQNTVRYAKGSHRYAKYAKGSHKYGQSVNILTVFNILTTNNKYSFCNTENVQQST